MMFNLNKRNNQTQQKRLKVDKYYLQHKLSAKEFIEKRVSFWSTRCEIHTKKISVRDQKTRWGSCSSRGNLNFNYKLLFLPIRLSDYIFVHELCHLKELNHSKRFWLLVQEQLPDYKDLIRDLRRIEKITKLRPQEIIKFTKLTPTGLQFVTNTTSLNNKQVSCRDSLMQKRKKFLFILLRSKIGFLRD